MRSLVIALLALSCAALANTPGQVINKTCSTNQWFSAITSNAPPVCSQPAFSNISGNLATSQFNSGTGASSSTFWRGDGQWASVVSGAPSFTVAFATTTGNIPPGQTVTIGNCASTCTLTLPAISAVLDGSTTAIYFVKNITVNTLTLAGNGSDQVEFASSALIKYRNTALTLVATSSGWLIL